MVAAESEPIWMWWIFPMTCLCFSPLRVSRYQYYTRPRGERTSAALSPPPSPPPPPPPSSDIHVCTPAGSCARPRLMRGRNGRRGVVDSIGSLCCHGLPDTSLCGDAAGQPPDSRRTDCGQPPDGRRGGLRTAADTYCSEESGPTAGHWRQCRKERVCSKANWTVSGGEAILVCCIERRGSRKSLA